MGLIIMLQKPELEKKNKNDILAIAKKMKIKGRSLLNKDQLIKTILKSQNNPKKRKTTKSKKMPILKEIAKMKELQKSQNLLPYDLSSAEYQYDKVILIARDPYWAYAYWEITDDTKTELQTKLKTKYNPEKLCLRVHNVTNNTEFYLQVGKSPSWFIEVNEPNSQIKVFIGYENKGKFIPIAGSKVISMPTIKISQNTEEYYFNAITGKIEQSQEPVSEAQYQEIIRTTLHKLKVGASEELVREDTLSRPWLLSESLINVSSFSSAGLYSSFR
ncbi:DUF4912 domain-containing protein [Candidatus Margulisiibacteriota bacterium]